MTIIERIEILESLKDIKDIFVSSGRVSQDEFQYFVENDPTKTKKYVEKMCRWISDAEMSKSKYVELFSIYNILCSKKLIKRTDIYSFKEFKDFKDFVNQNRYLTSKAEEKEKIKRNEADIILDNERWFVVNPKTHSASCIFGAGSKWCTASRDSSHWSEYSTSFISLYYCFDKLEPNDSPMKKFAVAVYPDGMTECYNVLDERLTLADVLRTGISRNIFKPKSKPLAKVIKSWFSSGYSIDVNGYYWTDGDVHIKNWKGDKLPIRFKYVGGDFYCPRAGLKTLVGIPETVGKNFTAHHNKLESLEYSPLKIGGNYDCSENNLKTLEGVTQYIPGDFNCSFNKLKSLIKSPKYVGGNYYCADNNFDIDIERPNGINKKFIVK